MLKIKISMHPRVFYFTRQEYLDEALTHVNRPGTSESFKIMYLTQFSEVVVNRATMCVEKSRLDFVHLIDRALGNPHTRVLSDYSALTQTLEETK